MKVKNKNFFLFAIIFLFLTFPVYSDDSARKENLKNQKNLSTVTNLVNAGLLVSYIIGCSNPAQVGLCEKAAPCCVQMTTTLLQLIADFARQQEVDEELDNYGGSSLGGSDTAINPPEIPEGHPIQSVITPIQNGNPREAKRELDKYLKGQGFDISGDNITLPNGDKYRISDFESGKIKPNLTTKDKKAAEKYVKDFLDSNKGFLASQSRNRGSRSSSEEEEEGEDPLMKKLLDMQKKFAFQAPIAPSRKKVIKSIMHKGKDGKQDQIGTADDDIFKMISRAYQKRAREVGFLP